MQRLRAFFFLTLGICVASLAHAQPASKVGAAASAPTPPPAATFLAPELAESLVKQRADALPAGGILAAIVDAQGVRYFAHGKMVHTPQNIFELGAISKVFTGILLASAASRGEVKRADTVGAWVPVTGETPQAQHLRRVRVESLATHRAGLPRLPCNLQPFDAANPYGGYRQPDLLGLLTSSCWRVPTQESYQYSSVAYAVLGYGLARQAQTSYASLLQQRVVEPLELSGVFSQVPPERRDRFVPPHNAQGKATAAWDMDALAPALGLKASAEDVAKLLTRIIRPQKEGVDRALTLALQPRGATDVANTASAMGWQVTQFGSTPIHWQSGATFGSASFVGVDRQHRRAVLVLSNVAAPVDELALRLLLPTGR
jgi:serine-type D-Ala-D-Ala carboxypeptidase/endopeptidase